LTPKLVFIILKHLVRTSKRTLNFTFAKISRLIPFKKMIAVYSENLTRPINIKWILVIGIA
jgi:hypothetical protein